MIRMATGVFDDRSGSAEFSSWHAGINALFEAIVFSNESVLGFVERSHQRSSLISLTKIIS